MLQVIGALSRRRELGINKMGIRRDSTAVGEMSGRCLIGVGSSAWRGTVLPLMGEKVWKCTNQRKDLKAGVALACLKNHRPCDRTHRWRESGMVLRGERDCVVLGRVNRYPLQWYCFL